MFPFCKVAIIGSGNVAYTYSKVLVNNGIYPKYILIRNKDRVSEVEKLFGVKATTDYNMLFDCDLIIIAVKDDAIKDVASNLRDSNAVLVHTSGTQKSTVLNVVENYGIIYPLQTISKDYEIDFKSIPLLINASTAELRDKLKSMANIMSDIVIECTDEDRSYIHMNAVYVSNFVNVMLQIGEKLLRKKSLDISILKPLVMETINKAFAMGAENALTGPARRHDLNTINNHLSLLNDDVDERRIYELLTDYILKKY